MVQIRIVTPSWRRRARACLGSGSLVGLGVARGDLSQQQREILEAVLPVKAVGRRRPRDHRRVIDGIRWRIRTGAPWCDIPQRYGPDLTTPPLRAGFVGRRSRPAWWPRPGRPCGDRSGLPGRRRGYATTTCAATTPACSTTTPATLWWQPSPRCLGTLRMTRNPPDIEDLLQETFLSRTSASRTQKIGSRSRRHVDSSESSLLATLAPPGLC
ncbi:transposase [Pseudonocardia charpentierae]|uniref:transposase n=1 Tax=Pseudonocardia charpentierae TaxID=3075545 RepID=UPI0037CB1E79